ncbi:Membrane-bound lytic murein transglycosylase D precursor [Candidatus Arthromitus sp. SFB-mouse-NL]|jgi:Soluble lytic murein transglycosylase and related regulatory proteins (some contain LysM/invasin domains)|uniref:lytic transglycosylase domain-containing protein n=1 Tax=Candidatus Arthromitus sp. SFB-mouse-NL TaxID=1508644 RepID=UPI00049B5504|nr:lytic transglycosylase domain-containing protein [Candidatus Arthromitus sp. SFB-mouse-NL]AID45058.1 Membrane-bound lytic murein transglycosylase D precursor [Candidatus Arthromitus sp. SFB-mouse-NL]
MGAKSIEVACAVGLLISQVAFNNVHNTSASGMTYNSVVVEANDEVSQSYLSKKFYRVNITKNFECVEIDCDSYQENDKNTIYNEVDSAIMIASKKYGVDDKLIRSLIKQESNFNPRCVSHAGAIGLMQIMPNTIKKFNVQDPYDIYENIDAGTKHLKGMIERYSGDIVRAVAAYNCGGNALDKSGFRSLEDVSMLPKETRIHVTNIIHYYNNGF